MLFTSSIFASVKGFPLFNILFFPTFDKAGKKKFKFKKTTPEKLIKESNMNESSNICINYSQFVFPIYQYVLSHEATNIFQ